MRVEHGLRPSDRDYGPPRHGSLPESRRERGDRHDRRSHRGDGRTDQCDVENNGDDRENRRAAFRNAGELQGVTLVQRIGTHGGIAPAGGCDVGSVGAETKVPYTATYVFYR